MAPVVQVAVYQTVTPKKAPVKKPSKKTPVVRTKKDVDDQVLRLLLETERTANLPYSAIKEKTAACMQVILATLQQWEKKFPLQLFVYGQKKIMEFVADSFVQYSGRHGCVNCW